MRIKSIYLSIVLIVISFLTLDAAFADSCKEIDDALKKNVENPVLAAISDHKAGKIEFYIHWNFAKPKSAFGLNESVSCILEEYGEKQQSPYDSVANYIFTDAIVCENQTKLWLAAKEYFEAYNSQTAAKLRAYSKKCF